MLKAKKFSAIILLTLFCVNFAFANPQIYVSDNNANEISRYQNDGSDLERLLISYESPNYMAIDSTNSFLYWPASNKIVRTTFNGTEIEELFNFTDGIVAPIGIAVDPVNGYVYWGDSGKKIMRGNADGTGSPTTLFDSSSGVGFPTGVAIDVDGGKVYWSQDDGKILRGNIDGTGAIQQLFNTGGSPIAIIIDVPAGNLYWSDNNNDRVERGKTDGTLGVQTVYTGADGLVAPAGLSLDLTTDLLYIAEVDGAVKRGNKLGGGGLTTVFNGTTPSDNSSVQGIAVDPSSDSVFFTGDIDLYKNSRDGSAGTTKRTDLRNAIFSPGRFALDLPNNHLYSVDASISADETAIKRVDLDFEEFISSRSLTGTVTNLFNFTDDGIASLSGFAIDPNGGKIYWSDTGTQKIQRGNLDGTGAVEDLFDKATDPINNPRTCSSMQIMVCSTGLMQHFKKYKEETQMVLGVLQIFLQQLTA